MIVGYLTVVFSDDTSAKTAKHLVDEIASEAISYEAVSAVKCDIGELDAAGAADFWEEANEA